LGKEAPVVNKWEAEWAPALVWTFGEENNIFISWDSNPRSSSPEPSRYTNYTTPAPMGVQ